MLNLLHLHLAALDLLVQRLLQLGHRVLLGVVIIHHVTVFLDQARIEAVLAKHSLLLLEGRSHGNLLGHANERRARVHGQVRGDLLVKQSPVEVAEDK